MKLCERHWKKVLDSFGHVEVQDINQRLKLIIKDYGFDPWLTTGILVMQKLLERVDPTPYQGNIANLQYAMDKAGGCPVCFLGDETFLDDCINDVKQKRMPPPTYIR